MGAIALDCGDKGSAFFRSCNKGCGFFAAIGGNTGCQREGTRAAREGNRERASLLFVEAIAQRAGGAAVYHGHYLGRRGILHLYPRLLARLKDAGQTVHANCGMLAQTGLPNYGQLAVAVFFLHFHKVWGDLKCGYCLISGIISKVYSFLYYSLPFGMAM